ncbi:MAG: hybrid sensor histidine kinase/response regulator, partial [Gammaproteobacteria bacterium]
CALPILHALALFNTTLAARQLEPETRHVVAQIGAAVDTLERMFDALLDISRLEAGVMQVRIEAFDLGALIDDLRGEFTPLAAARGLVFEAPPTQCWVSADGALLERILRNLLSNAVRYSDTGTVALRTIENDAEVRIEVADRGRGIAAADQVAIFEEFHQLAAPPGGHREGLGLGLTIVKRAAQLLGSRIELRSAVGTGSVFALRLPRAAPAPPAAGLNDSGARMLASPVLDLLTVLVLDDDPGILRGMRTLLQDWQCEPLCCASHAEVLAVLATGARPRAIVADFRLGGEHTGVDAIRAVRAALGAEVPAIIVTGDIVAAELRRAEAAGIPILHKPVAPARLRSFLRAVARNAGT